MTGTTNGRTDPAPGQPTPGQTRAPRSGGGVAFGSFTPTVITDARSGASKELAARQRRYAITMAFRTACFIAMIFVPGVFRWILFAGAVFLPYVAVIFANQANQRDKGTPVGGGNLGEESAVTSGHGRAQLTSGEIISGDVQEESTGGDGRDRRRASGPGGPTRGRDDRVA